MSTEAIKKAVGHKAAEYVENGMRIGLGTGSTTFFFIQRIAERCREGLKVQAVASSEESKKLAQQGGIPLLNIDEITTLDLTVDGADEVDPQKRLIKGGGGAHVREKIVAAMSRELIIIVDESKLVPALGKRKLPVEVVPFAYKSTLHHIAKAGYRGEFRLEKSGQIHVTDNGNFLIDIHFPAPLKNPEEVHETLIRIPGVVDTGFFFNLAGRIIVGFNDGQVVVKP